MYRSIQIETVWTYAYTEFVRIYVFVNITLLWYFKYVTHVLQISINEVFRFFKRKKDQYTYCIKGTQPCNGVTSTVTRRTTRLTGFVTVVTVVTQIIFYKVIECTKWKHVSNLNWFTKYAFCRWIYWINTAGPVNELQHR